MQLLAALLSIFVLCQARPYPSPNGALRPSLLEGGEQYIVGGTDVDPGEFPWFLSLERQSPTWTPIGGATLLSANYGLTAAREVDGIIVSNLRVVAGLHQQSDLTGTQTVDISSYTVHPNYGTGIVTYSNDIAILNFATPVIIGGNVQPATLPEDNSNSYAGRNCVIVGWSSTGGLPLQDILQKASLQVLSTSQCASLMGSVATISDSQICLYDSSSNVEVCSGDMGNPLHCQDGGTRVAGIGSWIITDGGSSCQRIYPAVYTRVSAYLGWIDANTP